MQPQPGAGAGAEAARRRASSSKSTSTGSTAPRRGIGCMAGILRLISPYHRSQHRKRLTAKNAAKDDSAAPPPSSSPPRKKAAAAQPSPAPPPVKPPAMGARRRRSCDAPRSPTIAMEHRRSSCDSPRPPPPAIVARLMGLEESAPPSPAAAASTPRTPVVLPTRPPPPPPRAPSHPAESAAEKRRKLLGALEKCDEDLKTLRRIIAAVRAAEMRAAAASDAGPTPPAGKGAVKWAVGRDGQSPSPSPSPPTPQRQQHPSPDSVLDAISSPRYPCRRKRPSPCTDLDAGGKAGCGNGAAAVAPTVVVASRIVKPSRTLVFSGDYYSRIKSSGGDESQQTARHAIRHPIPTQMAGGGLPRSAGSESWRHHRRRWEQEAAAAGRVIGRAMAESVAEAMMWVLQQGGARDDEAQRCERGWVAAALERAIAQDLVADLVDELLAQSGHGTAGGCRKRLCF